MGTILIRHPRADAAGICYGRWEPPLANGWEAEIALALRLTPAPLRLVTSPASRCRVLADAFARRHGLTPLVDPRLAELDFGAWEGRRWAKIPRTESDPWAEDPETRAPPGGETFAALAARVAEALAEHGDALVVTHAGPIRAAWIRHKGMRFADAFGRAVPHARPLRL